MSTVHDRMEAMQRKIDEHDNKIEYLKSKLDELKESFDYLNRRTVKRRGSGDKNYPD